MKPRVVHCITRLGLGGAEAVALSIVRSLHAECHFAVFAVRGADRSAVACDMRAELSDLGVPLFSGPNVSQKFGGMPLAGLAARAMARRFRPALFHLHTEIPEAAFAAMAVLNPAAAAGPVVRTIHNSVYWHFWPRLGRWCERRMRRSFVAGVSADACAAYRDFRDTTGAGPLPAEPVLIYNGVSVHGVSDASPSAARLHVPLRVLFAGRFEPQKGTDLLPAILRAVTPPPGGAELVLHGSGAHAGILQALALQPPAGWRVHVLPPVPDLPRIMAGFDLVIMPSRFEGLGLVAVEAALVGVPAVVTEASGLREVFPASHPWRARPGDAASFAQTLQHALETRARWPEIVQKARAFARERFAPQRMARSYLSLYRQALG